MFIPPLNVFLKFRIFFSSQCLLDFLLSLYPSGIFTLASWHYYPQLCCWAPCTLQSDKVCPNQYLVTEIPALECSVALRWKIQCPRHAFKLPLIEPSSYIFSFCQDYFTYAWLKIFLTYSELILFLCIFPNPIPSSKMAHPFTSLWCFPWLSVVFSPINHSDSSRCQCF